MSVRASGWRHPQAPGSDLRLDLGERAAQSLQAQLAHPGMAILAVGVVVAAVAGLLEILNPHNFWLLFEDVSAGVAPTAAAVALLVAGLRGVDEPCRFRLRLACSMGFVAAGQLIADIPDVFHRTMAPLAALAQLCYAIGAAMGVAVMMVTLYGRIPAGVRRAVLLDGLVMMSSAVTITFAAQMAQVFPADGPGRDLLANPGLLLLPLVSAVFFASAAAIAAAALVLRVEPSLRGVWALDAGVVLIGIAWHGWIGRIVAGGSDGIEPMDFIFPAGALLTAYGGLTWDLKTGTGIWYNRLAGAITNWGAFVSITACVAFDVLPHREPLPLDPISIGTGVVVVLALGRQLVVQGLERKASRQLATQIGERAAAAVALARLEAGPTVEKTADRICAEALHIEGIDSATVLAFTPTTVISLAQSGPSHRLEVVGEPLSAEASRDLRRRAEQGLWLESWADPGHADRRGGATPTPRIKAEAFSPLVWNEEVIGLLAIGALSADNAGHLSDRLATLTEFSVMSAAVLGPMMAERSQRELVQTELQEIIDTTAFWPVFQPIVDISTGKSVGFEALTRFTDGVRPDVRFLAAEKVGMMVRLETACLREQLAQARLLPKGAFVSLNVSPTLAIALIPLLDVLSDVDRPVVLEITEHLEIDDYPRLVSCLDQVRDRCQLAVDDAGAGYAGLRHILELRPKYVKLDISLIRHLDSDPARQAMVAGMAHFAQGVGCDLIAEGIETANEMSVARLLGVRYGQGYFLGKPGSARPKTVTIRPKRTKQMGPMALEGAEQSR